MAMLAGIAALIIVSLLTPPEPKRRSDSFFGRLQTPAGETESNEYSVTSGQGLDIPSLNDPAPSPGAAERGHQSLLVNLLRLRKGSAGKGIWRAYRIDLKGLVIGWTLALLLVLVTWVFFQFF